MIKYDNDDDALGCAGYHHHYHNPDNLTPKVADDYLEKKKY